MRHRHRYYTVTYIDYNGEQQVAQFDTHAAAWRFLEVCDETGTPAGYPEGVK
jgi:hypothetical protein